MAIDTDEAKLRELLDKEAIRDLARRYAHCVWQKDVDGAIALFTDDAEMNTGGRLPIVGREALLKLRKPEMRRRNKAQHRPDKNMAIKIRFMSGTPLIRL